MDPYYTIHGSRWAYLVFGLATSFGVTGVLDDSWTVSNVDTELVILPLLFGDFIPAESPSRLDSEGSVAVL